MKNVTRHTGRLRVKKALRHSRSGNPRFRCFIETASHPDGHEGAGVSFVTGVDASHNYEIRNLENRQVVATIGTHRGHATLHTIREVSTSD